MIVPSNRLISIAGLSVVPALTLIGLGGGWVQAGLLVLCATVGVAVVDWALSLEFLAKLSIASNSPVRAIVGRSFEFNLTAHWNRPRAAALKLEFDATDAQLQFEISPDSPAQDSNSANGHDASSHRRVIQVNASTSERGRYFIDHINAQCNSLLGLWWLRRRIPVDVRIHSYPDLHNDRRMLAAQAIAGPGVVISLGAGQGRSFDRLREYVPGDQLDDIHWRATAKRHRLITKLYQIEKDQRIYVAIDQSRTSFRASPRENPAEANPVALLERYVNVALVLGGVAQSQGDLFGLLGFSDQVTSFVAAGGGPAHYRACREAVLDFRSRRVNADYRELFSYFSSKVRRRSMLFVLTSVDDPALCEELIECSRIVADRHWVVAAAVAPPEAQPLGQAKPIENPDEIFERLQAHLTWKRLRQTARQLERHGIHFLSLRHESMAANVVTRYAQTKRGQLL